MGLFDKHFPSDETEVCEDCGRAFSLDELHYVDEYGYVCSECLENSSLVKCSKCGSAYSPDDCTQLEDGSWVCLDCDGDLYWAAHE